MDSDIGRSTDRISKLPDSLLCHILSFLPTKHAVGTGTLSKRWQHLWTYVTTLDFDDSVLFQKRSEMNDDREAEVDLSFMNFVNRVLLLGDASSLKKFTLRLQSFCDFDLVNTWINAAIKRNVQELDLHYSLEDEDYIENPVQLPRSVFTSKTLVNLRLQGDIFIKIPASVWLPSLKILYLTDLTYENEETAQKLFSGCPALEELFIYRGLRDIQQVFNISVPTLKHLMVTRFKDDFFDSKVIEESVDQRYKFVVNAPKLERLHLQDSWAEDFSLVNLSSLLKAYVVSKPSCSRPVGSTSYDGHISKVLRGIANVKFLDIQIDFSDYMLPTFHNLTQLKLGSWNLKLLADFLQCSPNLEVLILEESRLDNSAVSWNPPQEVPSCLLLHLKKIRINEFSGNDYALDMIGYLLKNAKVLKKMTINCQHSEECFCGELAVLPRGSKTCQLNLLL